VQLVGGFDQDMVLLEWAKWIERQLR
jgi:hypothetical protein